MKKYSLKKIAFSCMIVALSFILLGCDSITYEPDDGSITSGEVPIYQGMVVSEELDTTQYETPEVSKSSLIEVSMDLYTHNEMEEPDQDDPFDNFDGETIEDEIDHILSLDDATEVEYYTSVEEDFYITIKLLNPDNYVILSFVLNGEFYQSYQFQDGSDSENLILKVNAGSEPGIFEYTVDSIKYVDGSEINDALIGGEQTVKVGVEFSEVPMGNLTNHSVTPTTVSFTAQVSDQQGLIESAGDHLKAVLYDGNSIIREQDLELGTTNVIFDKLNPNTLYQYGIVTAYDILDENGIQGKLLSAYAFHTSDIVNLTIDSTDQETVSFTITEDDRNDIGQISSIVATDETHTVTLEDLSSTVLSNLYSGREYNLIVTYQYDLSDGEGIRSIELSQSFTTVEKSLPTVELIDVLVGRDSVSFDYTIDDKDDIGTFSGVKLFKDGEIVDELLELSDLSFTNLYTNSDYTIGFEFNADLNDGLGARSVYVEYEFHTLAKPQPNLEITNIVADTETVSFGLNVTDVESLGELIAIKLYDGDTFVSSLSDLTLRNFDNLMSNHTYTIQATYSFDDGDGQGVRPIYFESEFTTNAKSTPDLEFFNINEYESSFTFEVDIIDPDVLADIYQINLYDANDELYQSITDLTMRTFSDIAEDSSFRLEVIIAYDLNDGFGVQYVSYDQDIFTKPYLGILSTEVINTTKLTEGDTLVIEMTLDNPTDIDVSSVIFNGDQINVSPVSTNQFLRLEIEIDDTYDGGWTDFEITHIVGLKDGKDRSFDINENNKVKAFINGDLLVNELYITDENEEELFMAMIGETYYIHILLDNPTEYNITELVFNYPLYKISDEDTRYSINETNDHIVIEVTNQQAFTTFTYSLTSISYEIDNSFDQTPDITERTKSIENIRDSIVLMNSTEYTLIYDASGLANMKNGYAYKLANDIDMTNVIWEPKNLNYIIFDGNGYSINNFRHVTTYTDTSVNFGLFKHISNSTLANIVINDALIMITMNNSTTSNEYSGYVGILASEINNSIFSNIIVNGQVSLNNQTSNNSHNSYVGGVVSSIDNSTLQYIYANVIAVSDGHVGSIGGRSFNTIVKGIYTEGEVQHSDSNYSEYAGGLFGNSSTDTISDSYSLVDVTGRSISGGLLGWASNSTLTNTYFAGTLAATNGWGIGLLVGYNNNITINYSFVDSISNYASIGGSEVTTNGFYTTSEDDSYATPSTIEDIKDIMMGEWNAYIWSFNNVLPALKWKPTIRINQVSSTGTTIDFNILSTDLEGVGEVVAVELYKDGELVDTLEDFTILSFTDLDYNSNYSIKVTYAYNYDDGLGIQYIYTSYNIKTEPIEGAPEVSFDEILVSDDAVDFTLSISDEVDGSISEINIYSSTYELIDTLTTFDSLHFEELNSDTTYILEVIYSFDMNDGHGVQYIDDTEIFTTNPEFNVLGISLNNTDDLYTGMMMVIDIEVENPNGITFNNVVINGVTYEISRITEKNIRIQLTIDENFNVGELSLVLEAINGEFNSIDKTYEYAQDALVIDTYIYGDIYVESLNILNENDEEIDVLSEGETYYVEVVFFNPSAYTINGINGNALGVTVQNSMVTQEDDYTIIKYEKMNVSNVNNQTFTLTYFNYTNDYTHETISEEVSGFKQMIASVPNSAPIYIYTVQDLQNMETSGYYILMDDIDLSGVNWTPKEFYGYFDGNNHTISNLSMIKTFENEYNDIGLFSTLNGSTIINLRLVGVSFILTYTFNEYSRDTEIGALAGSAYHSIIQNVFVDSDIAVTTSGEAYNLKVGNVIGYGSESNLKNIFVKGFIESNGQYNGGIVGYLTNSNVSNVYTEVVIGENSSYDTTPAFGWINGSSVCYVISNGKALNYGFATSVSGYSELYFNVSISSNFNDVAAYPLSFSDTSIIKNSFTNYFNEESSSNSFISASLDSINQWIKNNYNPNIWDLSGDMPILKFKPTLKITSLETSEADVTFELSISDIEQIGYISSIEILYEGQVFTDLEDFELRTIEGLRYSTHYVLSITYTYAYGDGEYDYTVNTPFKTQDKENIPVVEIVSDNPSTDTVEFNVNITDALGIGYLSEIQLLDEDSELIDTLTTFDSLTFSHLLSNETYQLRAVYVYDFDDGFGASYVENVVTFTTDVKVDPTISMNLSSQEDTVNYNLTVTDPHAVFILDSVELYDGELLIETLYDLNGAFTELAEYNEYTVLVNYHYNLNTGSDDISVSSSYQIKTSPHLSIHTIEVLNNEGLMVGDNMVVEINLDNPSDIVPHAVVVNGVTYEVVDFADNTMTIYIELTSDFEGGNTVFTIESILATYNSENFSITQSANNVLEAYINGELTILGVMFVDIDGNEIEYAANYDTVYADILLNNPSAYSIDAISTDDIYLSFNSYEVLDTNTIRVSLSVETGPYAYFRVDNITYSNEFSGTKQKASNATDRIVIVDNNTINDISSVEDLQNMTDGGIYQLVNDIDLDGVSWYPKDFQGVILGNGFSISNLTIVRTYEDTSAYVGLFNKLENSYVADLKMKNYKYIITIRSSIGSAYESYIGGLSGVSANYNVYKNVYVEGKIDIDNRTNGYNYIGGITGQANKRISVINAYSKFDFNRTSGMNGYVAGISGYSGNVVNSIVELSTNDTSNVALFIGGYSTGYILNSYAILLDTNAHINFASSNETNIFDSFNVIDLDQSRIRLYEDDTLNFVTSNYVQDLIESKWDHTVWDFDNLNEYDFPTLIWLNQS